MKPKFMDYAQSKEQLVQWQLIYKHLSSRQKVKWRKEMHRALKSKTSKTNFSSKQEEMITINV